MSVQVERRYFFNVDEYSRMGEAGIFSEDDRVELIEGEIVKMSPIGSRHAACVDRINSLLHRLASQMAIVRVQNPIILDDYSEPQPDVSLLRLRADFYAQGHPKPADLFLVVEVADTSVEYDRNVKVPLYARAGIPEVWLVNLTNDTVEIYTQPVSGSYQNSKQLGRGESFGSSVSSDLVFNIDMILG